MNQPLTLVGTCSEQPGSHLEVLTPLERKVRIFGPGICFSPAHASKIPDHTHSAIPLY